jgi:hypothetical protein
MGDLGAVTGGKVTSFNRCKSGRTMTPTPRAARRSSHLAGAGDYRCRWRADQAMLTLEQKGGAMRRAATVVFAAMIAFETALVAGARLGEAAWGGTHAQLTTGQRFGSAVSVLFYAAAILIVRRRAAGRAERRYRWGRMGTCGHLRRVRIDQPGIPEPVGERLDGSRGARARDALRDRRARTGRPPRAHRPSPGDRRTHLTPPAPAAASPAKRKSTGALVG